MILTLFITIIVAIILVAVALYAINALVTDAQAANLLKVLVIVLVAVFVIYMLMSRGAFKGI